MEKGKFASAGRLTTTDPNNHVATSGCDAAGQLTSVTDRNGRQRTFGYDNAGRRTSELWKDAGGATIRTLSWTYDAAGRLTAESDPDASYAYTYGSRRRWLEPFLRCNGGWSRFSS